jgi:hypothetical protein
VAGIWDINWCWSWPKKKKKKKKKTCLFTPFHACPWMRWKKGAWMKQASLEMPHPSYQLSYRDFCLITTNDIWLWLKLRTKSRTADHMARDSIKLSVDHLVFPAYYYLITWSSIYKLFHSWIDRSGQQKLKKVSVFQQLCYEMHIYIRIFKLA